MTYFGIHEKEVTVNFRGGGKISGVAYSPTQVGVTIKTTKGANVHIPWTTIYSVEEHENSKQEPRLVTEDVVPPKTDWG